ncbi:Cupin RmlC-type [Lasiodiplodia theobromae]|uniref:Cupin RmlC-type n=1 Tax=Lasiodiplodia theobromae TaxID=45133 RepID=UPI0015C2CB38|nr:Cupin RmlC-type [Lasiodiplodia theobromae]KAF4543649.1 Cupin RmlC-type [Lasiodiplodia theobromae]
MATKSQKPLFLRSHQVSETPPSSFAESARGNTTWHTLLSAPATATDSLSGGIAVCPSNGSLALHRHEQAEIYYVLAGAGEVEIDGKRRKVSEGMMIWIPGNAEHGVFCGEERLKWLYIFPEGSFEDVVYRFREDSSHAQDTAKAKL